MSNLLISKENAEHYIWGNKCDSWMLVDSENLSIKNFMFSADGLISSKLPKIDI